MSVQAISAVFRHSTSKGADRLVLLALADVASDDGEVTAYRRSQSILAAKANIDAKTAQRALRHLAESGELVVLSAGSGRTSSDYRINLPGLGGWASEPPRDAPPAPERCPPHLYVLVRP